MSLKIKKNVLKEKVLSIMQEQARGKVLELGSGGTGEYSVALKEAGFDVLATDAFDYFEQKDKVPFKVCDITKTFPFEDESFDYVVLIEVIEHLRNPAITLQEIRRVLKKSGKFILTTPNILNIKSRFRYFFEGTYEYFREPPLEQVRHIKDLNPFQLHIVPYRYHELEYLLYENGLHIQGIHTSAFDCKQLFFLKPIIAAQSRAKERRVAKKKGLSHKRINDIILSDELFYGRHLILTVSRQ